MSKITDKFPHHCYDCNQSITKTQRRTSLVVHWIRIHLPMQGTRVQSLVQEDSTCHGATKPVGHGCRSPHPERTQASQQEKPPQCEARAPQNSPRSPQLEKAHTAAKTQHARDEEINLKKRTAKTQHSHR